MWTGTMYRCRSDDVKRMYSHKNLKATIDDIVESMPEEKLDFAMQQVQRTLDKKIKLNTH